MNRPTRRRAIISRRAKSEAKHDAKSKFKNNGEEIERICSKVFDNRDFGYLKITVERPLRLNFQTAPERIERLKDESAFAALAESKKRKNKSKVAEEEKAGHEHQVRIVTAWVTTAICFSSNNPSNRLFFSMRASICAVLRSRKKTIARCSDKGGSATRKSLIKVSGIRFWPPAPYISDWPTSLKCLESVT
jgi:hypothetical protein